MLFFSALKVDDLKEEQDMLGKEQLYVQMSDDELIQLIKNGNEELFDIIFQRYYILAIKTIKDFYLKSYELEDLLQEARMVFLKVIHTYDSEKGHTFGNFYKLNLKHHIFSLVRKDMAKKRRLEKNAESLEGLLEKKEHMQHYILHGKEQLPTVELLQVREKLVDYQETLSKFEQRVFLNYIHHMEVEEIADKLECDLVQVKNALDRCKRKMKHLFD